MASEEWHVVRPRKSRSRSAGKFSNRLPLQNNSSASINSASLNFPSAVRKQEMKLVATEDPAETAGSGKGVVVSYGLEIHDEKFVLQRERLLVKCRKAMEKVKQSPFFERFLQQSQDLKLLDSTWRLHKVVTDSSLSKEEVCADMSENDHSRNAACSKDVKEAMQLVVYGIGSMEESEVSRCQLSLALLLKESLTAITGVLVYDPIFTPLECLVLEDLGCSPMADNRNGDLPFSIPTLFYMPHCEAVLYDAVLKSNMHLLTSRRAIILGNSFRSYQDRWSLQDKSRKFYRPSLVLQLAESVEEHPLDPLAFPLPSAFNDTSWHFFF